MIQAGAAFSVRETHGILWRPEHRILASSDSLGWTSLYASRQHEPPYEEHYRAVRDHLIVLHLDGPVRVERVLKAATQSRLIGPGGLFMMPGGIDFGVRLHAPLSTVHVYVRDHVVAEVAADLSPGDPHRIELVDRFGDSDPLIERLALGVRDALDDDNPSASVYVDYLARALAARLVRAHSTLTVTRDSPRHGLSRAKVARVVEFMEANLASALSLDAIARAACLSATHFARAFKRATGLAPHQYLMRMRLERARRLLAQSDHSIARIAQDCGFSHQEHLTRAFRRLTGATPGAYRRERRD